MPILYQSTYNAIRNLGADETLVLTHMAWGYSHDIIKSKLEKRRDRDTKLSYEELLERIYDKLRVKPGSATERWRAAGKYLLDYAEMEREHQHPRPGSPPAEPTDDKEIDDLAVRDRTRSQPRAGFVATAIGTPNGANGMREIRKLSPPIPTVRRTLSTSLGEPLTESQQQLVNRAIPCIRTLTKTELLVLALFGENLDRHAVAERTGKNIGAINIHIVRLYKKLGLAEIPGRLEKRRLTIEVARVYLGSLEGGLELPPKEDSDEVPDTQLPPGEDTATSSEENAATSIADISAIRNGAVITFSHPETITYVQTIKTLSADIVDTYRKNGYLLEHAVALAQEDENGIAMLYVFVKRRVSE